MNRELDSIINQLTENGRGDVALELYQLMEDLQEEDEPLPDSDSLQKYVSFLIDNPWIPSPASSPDFGGKMIGEWKIIENGLVVIAFDETDVYFIAQSDSLHISEQMNEVEAATKLRELLNARTADGTDEESLEVKVLAKVREMVSDPSAWVQNIPTKTEGGQASYCLIEAVCQSTTEILKTYSNMRVGREHYTLDFIQRAVIERAPEAASIIGFNDAKTTTHEDVLWVLDRARELAS